MSTFPKDFEEIVHTYCTFSKFGKDQRLNPQTPFLGLAGKSIKVKVGMIFA